MKKARVYKTRPRRGSGFEYSDVARSLKQARDFVEGGYQDAEAIIVKEVAGFLPLRDMDKAEER